MKSWKKAMRNEIQAELEQTLHERISNELEVIFFGKLSANLNKKKRLNEEDRDWKEKIQREMKELKIKVSYFEMNGKNIAPATKAKSDKILTEDIAPLKEYDLVKIY